MLNRSTTSWQVVHLASLVTGQVAPVRRRHQWFETSVRKHRLAARLLTFKV
jgi:hypothetical protein